MSLFCYKGETSCSHPLTHLMPNVETTRAQRDSDHNHPVSSIRHYWTGWKLSTLTPERRSLAKLTMAIDRVPDNGTRSQSPEPLGLRIMIWGAEIVCIHGLHKTTNHRTHQQPGGRHGRLVCYRRDKPRRRNEIGFLNSMAAHHPLHLGIEARRCTKRVARKTTNLAMQVGVE